MTSSSLTFSWTHLNVCTTFEQRGKWTKATSHNLKTYSCGRRRHSRNNGPVTSHDRDAHRDISLSAWQLEVISLMGWMLSGRISSKPPEIPVIISEEHDIKNTHDVMNNYDSTLSILCLLDRLFTPLRVQSDDDPPVLWHRTSQSLVKYQTSPLFTRSEGTARKTFAAEETGYKVISLVR